MNISGVVVRTFPRNIDKVWQTLEQFEGVEVHGANEDGRLVVTIEKQGEKDIVDLLVHMQDVPGVLSASMVYHQFEDLGQQEVEQ
jgi:nitrate reductase NapD